MRGIDFRLASLYVKEAIWRHPYTQTWEVKRHYGLVLYARRGLEIREGGKERRQTKKKTPYDKTPPQGKKRVLNFFREFFFFFPSLPFSEKRKPLSPQ